MHIWCMLGIADLKNTFKTIYLASILVFQFLDSEQLGEGSPVSLGVPYM